MKKLILAAFIILALLLTTASGVVIRGPASPVLLTVYTIDFCIGCSESSDGGGCGECREIVKLHTLIKKQLGGRLYDGTIVYRMYNCRNSELERASARHAERYGIPADLRRILPIAYIGAEGSGVYLPGEEAMQYIQVILDRYIRGENADAIQLDIAQILNSTKP